MTISQDLKQRALDAYHNQDGSQAEIAKRFRIARSTLQRWLAEPAQAVKKEETRGRKPALDEDNLQRLEQLAMLHHSATETELAAMLAAPGEAPLHRTIIGRALRKLGLTRKKRRGALASKTAQMFKRNESSG